MNELEYPENYKQGLIDVQKKMEAILYDFTLDLFKDDRIRAAFIQDVATNFLGNMFLSLANPVMGEEAKSRLLEQAIHGFQSWVTHRKIDIDRKKEVH